MKILFVGGDKRTVTAFNELNKRHEVSSIGLFEGDSGDISAAEVIVLPVPATRDGVYVNCALTGKKILLSDISAAPRGVHIITYGYNFGRYPQTDYSKLDGFCIKNAISTAEGAIAAAVSKTDFTLFGAKILVIGYGRVGKVLANRLKGLGADLTVSARKAADFALLEALGIKHTETSAVGKAAGNYDIIFNTVDLPLDAPLCVFKSTFLFDLSTEGCVDFKAAEGAGVNAFKLAALPAKYAPVSAGKIIAETVEEILKTTQKY